MSVVGLDFGNKNVAIAAAGRGGVDVVLNGNSNRLNPNMSSFPQGQNNRSCGESASSTYSSNLGNTLTSMKRLIGLKFDSDQARKEMARLPSSLKFCDNKINGGVGVEIFFDGKERIVSVEQGAAMMISHLRDIAKANNAGQDVVDWVIGVPPYFSDQQKRSFLDACAVVGVDCLKLMDETTATALAYGIFKDMKKEFKEDSNNYTLFVDIGESAYSVSVVSFTKAKLTTLSTQWDRNLGGRDFDLAIAEWAAKKFVEKYPSAGNPKDKPKSWYKLNLAAEKAKKTLSPAGVKEARINIECLMGDYDFNCVLTSDELAEMTSDLLDRLEGPLVRALTEANIKASDLDTVQIVGGGTRVAAVKRRLAKILDLDANATNCGCGTTLNADEAVARGCALMSAILSPRFKVLPYEVIERQMNAIRLSWDDDDANATDANDEDEEMTAGDNSVVIFDRGSNFNVVKRVTLRRSGTFTIKGSYVPADEAQKAVLGEGNEMPLDICEFKVEATKSDPPNRVRINVKQDISGILTLSSAQVMEELPPEPAEPPKAPEESEKKDGEAETKAADGDTESKDAAESKDDDAAKNDSEMKDEAAANPVAPKKKYKKCNVPFSVNTFMRFSKVQLDTVVENEVAMANADRVAQETSDKRNELESYLYAMRDKIIGELKDYCDEADATKFKKELEIAEEWLYSDEGFDTTKSVYEEKLKGVETFGNPIEKRFTEGNARPAAITSLKGLIETYKQFINSTDERYSHITDTEKESCRKACNEADTWMYELIEKQGNTPAHKDPVLTKAMLEDRGRELTNIVRPIQNKPKPQPKKEEKKEEKKEDGVNEEGKGEGEGEKKDGEGAADNKMEDGGGDVDEVGGDVDENASGEAGPIPMDVD